jgi:ankyrin repeat protein
MLSLSMSYDSLKKYVLLDSVSFIKKYINLQASNCNIADVNNNKTLVIYASEHNKCKVLSHLLVCGASPNYQTYDHKQTALMYALKNQHIKASHVLIRYKYTDLNIQDNQGYQAIHYASLYNCPSAIESLHSNHVNLDVRSHSQTTPLMYACQKGHAQVVSTLIRLKARFDICDSAYKYPIDYACEAGHDDIITYLLEKQKKYSMRIGFPIHRACEYRRISYIDMFLKDGYDINRQDHYGKTALHYAVKKSYIDIVSLLLKKGAYVSLADKKDKTPLHIALLSSPTHINREIVALLFQALSDEPRDTWFVTYPLNIIKQVRYFDLAVMNNYTSAVIQCIKHDMHRESDIEYLFFDAIEKGHRSICMILSRYVCVPHEDSIDYYGVPFIHKVVHGKHLKLLRYLVKEHHYSITRKDRKGLIPLFYAVYNSDHNMINYLLDKGSYTSARDSYNRSLLSYAYTKDDHQSIDLLVRHGADFPDVPEKDLKMYRKTKAYSLIYNMYMLEHAFEPYHRKLYDMIWSNKHKKCVILYFYYCLFHGRYNHVRYMLSVYNGLYTEIYRVLSYLYRTKKMYTYFKIALMTQKVRAFKLVSHDIYHIIHRIVKNQDIELLKETLSYHSIDISSQDIGGMTALDIARAVYDQKKDEKDKRPWYASFYAKDNDLKKAQDIVRMLEYYKNPYSVLNI